MSGSIWWGLLGQETPILRFYFWLCQLVWSGQVHSRVSYKMLCVSGHEIFWSSYLELFIFLFHLLVKESMWDLSPIKSCSNWSIIFLTEKAPKTPVVKCNSLTNLQGAMGFSSDTSGKEPDCSCRRHKKRGFDPWVRKVCWRRAWQPTLVIVLPSVCDCILLGHPIELRVIWAWNDARVTLFPFSPPSILLSSVVGLVRCSSVL